MDERELLIDNRGWEKGSSRKYAPETKLYSPETFDFIYPSSPHGTTKQSHKINRQENTVHNFEQRPEMTA
ncbi:MAG: hypothetical protein U9N09_09290, partial [Euryarchaeota archaeon]|nr:hypothetical protein [Euryarchaeota archaeon]